MAYVRKEICVSKSIGLACIGKEIYHFCFVLLCIPGQIPSTSPLGGLYSEGRFNGGFFALRFWGAYIWGGLIHGGAYFRNFTVFVEDIGDLMLCNNKLKGALSRGYCCLRSILS